MIDGLRDALHHSPDNVPLRMMLAEALVQASRWEEAGKEYEEVLRISPGHQKAMTGVAQVSYHLGNYSKAAVILEDMAEQYPAELDILLLYARVMKAENNMAKGLAVYKKIIQLSPGFTDEELDAFYRNAITPGDATYDLDELFENENIERPTIRFKDVGGMDGVKEQIDLKIIKPLQHRDLYAAYGKKTGGGILLYGPPGCGKTHIARATAGEVDARFISIGINDILDMWIGGSEKNLHEVFRMARAARPCVLFFDEIDALGASRNDMKNSSGRHLINQFLAELDGVDSDNDGLLIVGATNAPWHLDQAFRRPGRFDRIIFVGPPDLKSREEIFRVSLQGKPVDRIDYGSLAKHSEGFSGADIKASIDWCIEEKLKDAFKTGIPEPISTKELLKSMKQVKPSVKEWFNSARNYALYANESGLYDDILTYLNLRRK